MSPNSPPRASVRLLARVQRPIGSKPGPRIVPDRRAGRVASRDSGAARQGVWRYLQFPPPAERTTPCASPATHRRRGPAVLSQAGELGAQRAGCQVPLGRGFGGVPQTPPRASVSEPAGSHSWKSSANCLSNGRSKTSQNFSEIPSLFYLSVRLSRCYTCATRQPIGGGKCGRGEQFPEMSEMRTR